MLCEGNDGNNCFVGTISDISIIVVEDINTSVVIITMNIRIGTHLLFFVVFFIYLFILQLSLKLVVAVMPTVLLIVIILIFTEIIVTVIIRFVVNVCLALPLVSLMLR